MERNEVLSIIMNNLQTQGRLDDVANNLLTELEQVGMLPPDHSDKRKKEILDKYGELFEWDDYHRCTSYKPGPWQIMSAPSEVRPFISTANMGEYSIAYLDVPEDRTWEDSDGD